MGWSTVGTIKATLVMSDCGRMRLWGLLRSHPDGTPLTILLAAYALTRLYHLTLLPVFLDEVLHIQWSLEILDPSLRVHALSAALYDAKFLQPVLLTIFTPSMSDPIWGARLLSVLAGGVT